MAEQTPSVSFFSASFGEIDEAKGIIRDVSVVTIGEARGHDVLVDATTLQQVKKSAKQYKGGIKVAIDHGSGFDGIVGYLRNLHVDGDKLLADLHLLKSHPAFSRVLELAKEIPDTFGLS